MIGVVSDYVTAAANLQIGENFLGGSHQLITILPTYAVPSSDTL